MKKRPVYFVAQCLSGLLLTAATINAEPLAVAPLNTTVQDVTNRLAITESGKQISGIFDQYRFNRLSDTPNLVTPDYLFVAYSLLKESLDEEKERSTRIPAFREWLETLKQSMAENPEKLDYVRKNTVFVDVVVALLNGKEPTDEMAKREYKLAIAAKGITQSPLQGIAFDYSQMTPRGRYSKDEEMQQYFRAWKYTSTLPFLMVESEATRTSSKQLAENILRSAHFTQLIRNNPKLRDGHLQILRDQEWPYGRAEDLTVEDMPDYELKGVTIPNELSPNEIRHLAVSHGRIPSIVDGVVQVDKLHPGQSPTDVWVSWRLFPSRYSSDQAFFQRMVFPWVGPYQGKCKASPFSTMLVNGKLQKGYPRLADLFATLGSNYSQANLTEFCEDAYQGYGESKDIGTRLLAERNGLQSAQLNMLRQIVSLPNDADAALNVNAAAGFWVWQKHANTLYAKQSYTNAGKGIEPASLGKRVGATISGSPVLYQQLRLVVGRHEKSDPHPRWSEFGQLLDELIDIAYKTSAQVSLTTSEEALLNDLDLKMAKIVKASDKPIVADVHTNVHEKKVLHYGVGKPLQISNGAAVGAIFSVYEIKVDEGARLTDDAWRLNQATLPARPWPPLKQEIK